jgi:hypothetical protein
MSRKSDTAAHGLISRFGSVSEPQPWLKPYFFDKTNFTVDQRWSYLAACAEHPNINPAQPSVSMHFCELTSFTFPVYLAFNWLMNRPRSSSFA